ncbi:mechanosensitive ion channel family protein [Tsuneonella sp. HG249]
MFRELDPTRYSPDWSAMIHAAVYFAGAILFAAVAHRIIFAMLERIAARTETEVDGLVIDQLRSPARWAFAALALGAASQADRSIDAFWRALAPFAVPALIGWIAYSIVCAFTAVLERRADASTELASTRSRKTRIAILSRTVTFVVVVVTVGLMLLAIPVVRQVGVTLMASAGIAALFVGAAAQPALKSLIAGLQMAITEPIRIGDLVAIDGQTGRVEEIRMSFVVLRLWDERTAIVPTSRFLDTTFENWTRANEVLTGAVLLHLDPSTEVAPLRAEFERFVAMQPQWDKRTAKAVVNEARAGSIEVRLAVSAASVAELGDLRFALREHILEWLRREQPKALLSPAIDKIVPDI